MHLARHLLDFILPTSCAHCGSRLGESPIPFFCSSCWTDFTLLQGPVCSCCGKPFESPETLTHSPDHECGACRLNRPFFDQSLSVGYFEGSLREAIHQFKYRPCRALGKPLGQWMRSNIRLISDVDLFIPVPLHAKRLKKRGFNQSLLLAFQISKKYKIPISYDNLVRIKPTKPQVDLSSDDRIENVADAFTVQHSALIKEKKIILVDDVLTTGATMNECARVLKDAGAGQVTALTLARAV